MAKKKLIHTNNTGQLYSSEKLKIHPVEADSEIEAIEKVKKYYAENKPAWEIRIVDSEPLIK